MEGFHHRKITVVSKTQKKQRQVDVLESIVSQLKLENVKKSTALSCGNLIVASNNLFKLRDETFLLLSWSWRKLWRERWCWSCGDCCWTLESWYICGRESRDEKTWCWWEDWGLLGQEITAADEAETGTGWAETFLISDMFYFLNDEKNEVVKAQKIPEELNLKISLHLKLFFTFLTSSFTFFLTLTVLIQ